MYCSCGSLKTFIPHPLWRAKATEIEGERSERTEKFRCVRQSPHSQLSRPIQDTAGGLAVGNTIALNDLADAPICAEFAAKAAAFWKRQHPFCEVGKQFPVKSTRNTEPRYAFTGKTCAPRQRNSVVVVPGEKIFLGGSARIDRMIHNCGRTVYDLLAPTDQSFSEFRIVASNGVLAASYPQIEP